MTEETKESPSKGKVIEGDLTKFEQRNTHPEVLPIVHSAHEIILEAVRKGLGKDQLEVLERMFEFDLRVKKQQAKELFFTAFSKFKQEEIVVLTDKINALFENHRYPSIGNFLGTVNPPLGRHDLSGNLRIEDSEDFKFIRVIAVITHSAGHSIEAGMSAEPDTTGPKGGSVKTMIHGRMSTVTHLMRTTFSAVTGIGSIDPEFDDDGNAAGKKLEYISTDQVTEINDLLKETGANKLKFFAIAKSQSTETILQSAYPMLIKQLKAKRDNMRQPGEK